MKTYVLDTSVVLKWYNQEGEKEVEQALSLLDDLRKGTISIIVPNLLIIELANVLIKGKCLSVDDTKTLVTSFFSLPVINKEPNVEVMLRTADICKTWGLTAYDSLYVATAQAEECQLISADLNGHGKITDGTVVMLEHYRST